VVEIYGENAIATREKFLEGPPIEHTEKYAAFSKLHEDTDLDFPKGLTQLLYINFSTTHEWIDGVLIPAFAPIGPVLRHSVLRKGLQWVFNVLVEYNKGYFEHVLNVVVPHRPPAKLALNYKSLAFRCFICRSLKHDGANCDSVRKSALPSRPSASRLPSPGSFSQAGGSKNSSHQGEHSSSSPYIPPHLCPPTTGLQKASSVPPAIPVSEEHCASPELSPVLPDQGAPSADTGPSTCSPSLVPSPASSVPINNSKPQATHSRVRNVARQI
jgi:hypothetical protein